MPERIRAVLPDFWALTVLDVPAYGSADGEAAVTPAVLEAVRDARVCMSYGCPRRCSGRERT